MAKDRVKPKYEGTGHGLWWDESRPAPVVKDHGASEVGTRALRHAKKKPTWPIVAMLVALVLIILAGLLLYQDYRRAVVEGRPPAVTSSASERPSGRVLHQPPSPDTIKRRLQKAGFEVDYLETTYDKLGYDAAKTRINGISATIVAFKDKATTKNFAKVGVNTGYVLVVGDTWGISFGQSQELATKQLTEQIAGKLHAKFYWTPEGE